MQILRNCCHLILETSWKRSVKYSLNQQFPDRKQGSSPIIKEVYSSTSIVLYNTLLLTSQKWTLGLQNRMIRGPESIAKIGVSRNRDLNQRPSRVLAPKWITSGPFIPRGNLLWGSPQLIQANGLRTKDLGQLTNLSASIDHLRRDETTIKGRLQSFQMWSSLCLSPSQVWLNQQSKRDGAKVRLRWETSPLSLVSTWTKITLNSSVNRETWLN